jgi:MoaA/NifB/PqqE/SkfB family radical SAM enzyme
MGCLQGTATLREGRREIHPDKSVEGLSNAIDAGFIVKVNTVFIPGINDVEIPLIAWRAGERGADIMNLLPLSLRRNSSTSSVRRRRCCIRNALCVSPISPR